MTKTATKLQRTIFHGLHADSPRRRPKFSRLRRRTFRPQLEVLEERLTLTQFFGDWAGLSGHFSGGAYMQQDPLTGVIEEHYSISETRNDWPFIGQKGIIFDSLIDVSMSANWAGPWPDPYPVVEMLELRTDWGDGVQIISRFSELACASDAPPELTAVQCIYHGFALSAYQADLHEYAVTPDSPLEQGFTVSRTVSFQGHWPDGSSLSEEHTQRLQVTVPNPFWITRTTTRLPGSLYYAAGWSDRLTGRQTIRFAIPTSEPGFDAATHTWRFPNREYYTFTEPVIIDGGNYTLDTVTKTVMETTNGEVVLLGEVSLNRDSILRGVTFGGTTDQYGYPIGSTLRLNGSNNVIENIRGPVYLRVSGNDNRLQGNALVAPGNIGIQGQNNVVVGSHASGIELSGYGDHFIGPGNTFGSVLVRSNHNQISGNVIGANNQGASLNTDTGINILGSYNVIGTDGDGIDDLSEGNIITGIGVKKAWDPLSGHGVVIYSGSENKVSGNYIGVTDGAASGEGIGNVGYGVYLGEFANRNVIGTDGDGLSDALERNVISSNALGGIFVGRQEKYVRIPTGNIIAGNLIGTDATGRDARPNGGHGIYLGELATGTRIGTNGDGRSDDVERNVISGNSLNGVAIVGAGTDGNLVSGNYIGTDVLGGEAIPNAGFGIEISAGARGNIVGTNGDLDGDAAERNLIAGNGLGGVMIRGAGTELNVVAGNYIGTDIRGGEAVANGSSGVFPAAGVAVIGDARGNRVGTDGNGRSDDLEGNLISGNQLMGVFLGFGTATAENTIAGNLIGTDAAGSQPVPNGANGVMLLDAGPWNILGTNGDEAGDSAERNVISGNSLAGIQIQAPQTIVGGNYIGTDRTGKQLLGNQGHGVLITGGSTQSRVGTDGDGRSDLLERNVISGNGLDGVSIAGDGTVLNVVAGNYVGTDSDGIVALGNGRAGGFPGAGISIVGNARGNIIGTNGDEQGDAAEGNLISANQLMGVFIGFGEGTSDNIVAGNRIGTDISGSRALGNKGNGILLLDAGARSRIGTDGDERSDEAERNIISGNELAGIQLNSSETVIAGNYIGTDVTGKLPLGNKAHGVLITAGGKKNRVGVKSTDSAVELERNVISANYYNGITITGIGADQNVVAGNYIGTDVTGTKGLGNYLAGVRIEEGAQKAIIGTDSDGHADALERNVISAHVDRSGIEVVGSVDEGRYTGSCVIAGNYIGTQADGKQPLGNWGGVALEHSNDNLIGSDVDGVRDADERNVVSSNGGGGIFANGDRNRVHGNYVGLAADGKAPLGNGYFGIMVEGSQNQIGAAGTGDGSGRNVIGGTGGCGVELGGHHNWLAGNYVGVDISGSLPVGNQCGVSVYGYYNIVGTDADGTDDALEKNVVSGNSEDGIIVFAHSNLVSGNFIGTDANGNGAASTGNGGYGVVFPSRSARNVVGSDGRGSALQANVISLNRLGGVLVSGTELCTGNTNPTDSNILAGNLIGTDASGTRPLGNGASGVFPAAGVAILGHAWNTVIGTNGDGVGDELERNVISANHMMGVFIGSASRACSQPQGSVVAGNLIGTDLSGTTALPNGANGILVLESGNNNRIGTNGDGQSDGLERNVISGNLMSGVQLNSGQSIVAGNYIGTDITGSAPLGNAAHGILITGGGTRNRVGTDGLSTAPESERNVVVANGLNGVAIVGPGTDSNVVAGNFIGTNGRSGAGAEQLGNKGYGIEISGGSRGNRIGTNGDEQADAQERNIVANNALDGVGLIGPGTTLNVVAGNYIGTDPDGETALPNGRSGGFPGAGIAILGDADKNRVGTDGNGMGDTEERNVISGNQAMGVFIGFGKASDNIVAGNFIGTNAAGDVALPNGANGVLLLAVGPGNVIGTNGDDQGDSEEGNVISGNAISGVQINASQTVVAGNYIGTDSSGLVALPNEGHGVLIEGEGTSNWIGTNGDGVADAAERNIISGNQRDGVAINGASTVSNVIAGNYIGVNVDGTDNLLNGAYAISIYDGAHNNRIGSDADGNHDEEERNLIAGPIYDESVVSDITPQSLQTYLESASAGSSVEVVLSSTETQFDAVLDAVNGLQVNSVSGTQVTLVVDLQQGSYSGQSVTVPPGVTLVIRGSDGDVVFQGASPALSVVSGTVFVEGVVFENSTDAPTILVSGGSLTMRNSWIKETGNYRRAAIEILGGVVDLGTATDPGGNTITVLGAGEAIHNTGNNSVVSIGNAFEVDGAAVTSPYRIEDLIFHALDTGGGGLVDFSSGRVFVTSASGSIQRGIEAAAGGGTVNVEVTDLPSYYVGGKLLTVRFQNGPSISLAPDALAPTLNALAVIGTENQDNIQFVPSEFPGEVDVLVGEFPRGTFHPTGRLAAYGLAGDDDLEVAGALSAAAWLYGGTGNDRLKGGNAHDVLLGEDGDDLLVGGGGRDLLIGGTGADRIVGNAGDDILISGYTDYDSHAAALQAIMTEWISQRSYQDRCRNIMAGIEYGFALKPNVTAYDDNAADILTGSEGNDWYFANLFLIDGDNANQKDKITDLKAQELAADLDWILGTKL